MKLVSLRGGLERRGTHYEWERERLHRTTQLQLAVNERTHIDVGVRLNTNG